MTTFTFNSKVDLQVELIGEYSFSTQWGSYTIYKMVDADGNIFVWKTSSCLSMDKKTERGNIVPDSVKKGDSAKIKATIKGFSDYNGEHQIELTRVRVVEITHIQKLRQEAKKEAQIISLNDGDKIVTMPYRQFKEHYSDCETVAGSFEKFPNGGSIIKVIIRNGREKPSGVRGQHFWGYELTNEIGEKICYSAVCEENAIRRANKEFPNHEWTCTTIYRHGAGELHRIW